MTAAKDLTMPRLFKFAMIGLLSLSSLHAFSATPVSGLYAEGFGGVAGLPGNVSKNGYTDVQYKSGYNVGGLIGIKTGPFHYNVEGLTIYTQPRNYQFNAVEQTATGNKISAILTMLNIGYEFKEYAPSCSLFAEVGLGYLFLSTQLTSQSPSSTSFSTKDNDFAMQAKIGNIFNFSENYAITGSYRYVRSASSDDNGKAYQGHLGQLGLIYRFEHL
jgi:opacity protein-like surface antigen